MQQEIKFPNPYNQCDWFCRKTACPMADHCVFGFNSLNRGMRELRLDFNRCNLKCVLCWSNNEDTSKFFSVEEVFKNFISCINSNHKYIVEIKKPQNPESFKILSLQIIGGEPLISRERFQFIFAFIQKINELLTNNFNYYGSLLKLDKKNRFKIKLFTNGITIGNDEISLEEIKKLNEFNHIRVDLLVSIKGFHQEGFWALQKEADLEKNFFEKQVSCLEKLSDIPIDNLIVQPVLGFYHSKHFNIKAPNIAAKDMFVFPDNELSQRLHKVLKKYISRSKRYGFFVEPVHAVEKQDPNIETPFDENSNYLERTTLIEPNLKSNSKTKYQDTKLKQLF